MALPNSAASSVVVVAARARLEPVALHHAVVDRRVGVQARGVGVVERFVGEPAIGLRSAGRQQLAILAVADLRGFAGRQRDGREARIRGRQRGVGILRHAAEPLGQRQQLLAPLVEHVLLQAEHFFDREAIDRELRRCRPSIGGRSPAAASATPAGTTTSPAAISRSAAARAGAGR